MMALSILILISVILALIIFILNTPSSGAKGHEKEEREAAGNREEKLNKKLNGQIRALESELKKEKENNKTLRDDLDKIIKREADLLNEKKTRVLDEGFTEKTKKELFDFRSRLADKEKAFDAEYSLGLKLKKELEAKKNEVDLLRKETREVRDSWRKLDAELSALKKKSSEQKKTIQGLEKGKDESSWISKKEYDRIESELKKRDGEIEKLSLELAKAMQGGRQEGVS